MSDDKHPPSGDAAPPSPEPSNKAAREAESRVAAADPEPSPQDPTGDVPAWRPLELGGLKSRLAEVKRLLEQASQLAAARDTTRLETMTALMQQSEEQARGGAVRRRYR